LGNPLPNVEIATKANRGGIRASQIKSLCRENMESSTKENGTGTMVSNAKQEKHRNSLQTIDAG